MSLTTGLRLPRFRRAKEQAPNCKIMERDTELMRLVAVHRYLRSGHLVSLAGGSKQQTLRRLQLLFHHGYLERPRCQLDYYQQGGSREVVYGLGSRGAAHLRRTLNLPFDRMDWSGKNRSVGRLFLEHALMVSDFMVALEISCRAHGGVLLRQGDELPLPEALRGHRDPFRWSVASNGSRRLGVVPDRVFALDSPDALGVMRRVIYLLEADRSTMPVMREKLERSSIHRKMLGYEATWRQRVHESRFGWNRFRVLFVTNSRARIEGMLQACESLNGGHGLFLFANAETLPSSADLLSHPWTATHGECGATLLA